MELEGKTLVLTRIHVRYELSVDEGADDAAIQRAFDAHPERCPVYRSVHPQIAVTTELTVRRS